MTVTTSEFAAANAMLDLEVVSRRTVEEGIVSPAAASAWLKDLKDRDQRGRFLACWVVFVVTGRKAK